MRNNNARGNTLNKKLPIKHFLLIMRTVFILLFTCVFCSMAEIGYNHESKVQNQQQLKKQITGTIVDGKGEPIIGANIIEEGTTNGTITDIDGQFSLNVADNATIKVSYIGYLEQIINTAGRTTFDLTLQEDTKSLEELVVIGYGTQKQATITGAISTLEGKELTAVPTANLTNSLAGKIPGLVVMTRSGEPGSDGSTLRIRGANTLGDNSPLVVVDGISNRDLQRLDPNDIESITVLKDASAAIYGSKAANGVILVTTKRGQQGKPQVQFSYNEGRSMPTVIPKSIDSATYLEVLNEISVYQGQAPKYSNEEIENYRKGGDPWLYPNTDWFAETFKSSAPQRNANLSISGGQNYLTYFVSVGTTFQDAIYKNSATNYKQQNIRVNLDGKLNDYVSYGVDMSALFQNRNYPTRSAGDIFNMLRRGKPNMHAYWPNGMNGPDIEYGNNPVVITTNQTGYDRNKRTDLLLGANVEVKLPWVKGLSFRGNAAVDNRYINDKLWQIPWYLYSWDGTSYDSGGEPILVEGKKGFVDPQLTQEMGQNKNITLNGLINYEQTFNEDHNFKALLGMERYSGDYMNFSAFRKNYVSPALDELFAGGDAEKDNNGSSSVEERMNYFGRVNYDYQNKYLLEFVWRYDGSFIFPEEGRFGFFPGVSLGWRISEEPFWGGLKNTVDYMKIRGSWGQTGNDRIDAYQYLSSFGYVTGSTNIYVFNGNVESKMLQELRIPNRNVTWEVANQSNIGFDAQMFDGKLGLNADYFYNLRSNILWTRNASVPGSTGLTLPRENIGEVENQGFEFVISYRNQLSDLGYNISLNLNFNKNKILFWDETPGIPEYQQSTGRPMNASLYYNAIGTFRDADHLASYPHWGGARPGDVIFEDVNKDGVIDGLDRVRSEKTDLPTHVGGLNLGLDYKNFYMNLFFQWATGAVRYDYYEMQGEAGNYLKRDVEGRWTTDNIDAVKPRIWNRYFEYWRSNANTYWLHNANYLRLKNLEIGYNVPQSLTRKVYLQGATIYFTGTNFLTFTGIKDFDPETTSPTAYPLNKVYNIGVLLTF